MIQVFFSSVENDHDNKVVLLVNFLLESLAASHGYYYMGDGCADALVVMLALASLVHSAIIKET